MLNSNISRNLAEVDIRNLEVSMAAQSSEGFEHHANRLRLEIEAPESESGPIDTKRDEEGFSQLKMMVAL